MIGGGFGNAGFMASPGVGQPMQPIMGTPGAFGNTGFGASPMGGPMMGSPMMGSPMMGSPMMGGPPMVGMAPGAMPGIGMSPMLASPVVGDMNMSVPLTEAAPQQGPTHQGGYVVTLPMQDTCCASSKHFDPVYSAGLPMEWHEFTGVIEEINQAIDDSLPPKFVQMIPFFMLGGGFILFAGGGFLVVALTRLSFNPLLLAVPACGFLLFVAGMASLVAIGCARQKGISGCRAKLSELNARYTGKRVDFQLHEQRHLEMHTSHHHNHHGGYGNYGNYGYGGHGVQMHTVTKYTLVIQALDSQGRRSIPTPQALQEAAYSNASTPVVEMQVVAAQPVAQATPIVSQPEASTNPMTQTSHAIAQATPVMAQPVTQVTMAEPVSSTAPTQNEA